MTDTVLTPTGARIAYDRSGDGPVVVLIGGALQFRAVDASTHQLVDELAARGLSAVHYDRPGRGDSSGVGSSLAAEVDAVRALIAEAGGRAALYGSSSGAAIALAAATEISGVGDLVLWEPPFGPEGGTQGADALTALQAVLPSADPDLIIGSFMQGMPPQWFDELRASTDWPAYAAMAPTLVADLEALAWAEQAPRESRWPSVPGRATVLVGDGAFDFLRDAAKSTAASLPGAQLRVFAGKDHAWSPGDLADQIATALRPYQPIERGRGSGG